MAEVIPAWEIAQIVAERLNIDNRVSENVVRLLEEDNTIPFIARYRREQTGNMDVDTLREVHSALEELRSVRAKIKAAASLIEKAGKLSEELKRSLKSAQSLPEVENLVAPYKPGSKKKLSERAKELGLEPLALKVFSHPHSAYISSAVKPKVKGLQTEEEVCTGVQNILSDNLSKDKEVMDYVRLLCSRYQGMLETSKTVTKTKTDSKEEKKAAVKPDKSYKYEQYFTFQCSLRNIKPHQVLAVNRAESEKILSVKVTYPDQVKVKYCQFCQQKWMKRDISTQIQSIIQKSIDQAFTRFILPQMCRKARADLTKEAEKASVDVFACNLKRLLLQPPVRGKSVCGLDPGFRNGCKMAITSETGQILHTDVLYVAGVPGNKLYKESEKLKSALLTFRCNTIAIGNGTACRETESYVSDLIKRKMFLPLDVVYCIVNENGASIYSVSDTAKKEMPQLDVNLRSAVSIARRLQDPLAELVKIEPKHIGVGMYQHDVSDKLLQTSLDSVVEECVSFVGVDINMGSECLLRRVAGLNASRAKNIIEWREQNGAFVNRAQIQLVKGIGPKSFVQCAGFVRIVNGASNSQKVKVEAPNSESSDKKGSKRKATTTTSQGRSKKAKLEKNYYEVNPLDRTCIHPESYDLAYSVLQEVGLSKDQIGEDKFVEKMAKWVENIGVEQIVKKRNVGIPTMQLIIDGLTQPLEHDIRADFEKPLFKQEMTSLSDLKAGCVVSGRVVNVTHFGAFVDIGVGQDGLIHVSKMPRAALGGRKALELGDRVEVLVNEVNIDKKRISLTLKKVL